LPARGQKKRGSGGFATPYKRPPKNGYEITQLQSGGGQEKPPPPPPRLNRVNALVMKLGTFLARP